MASIDLALKHAAQRIALGADVREEAARAWAQIDRGRIAESWLELLITRVLLAIFGGQRAAAAMAQPYAGAAAASSGLSTATAGVIQAASFAGAAADGRSMLTLMLQPVITALTAIGAKVPVDEAMALGAAQLDNIVHTEIADAGRTADQVAMIATPSVDGYIRVVVGDTCSRCIILAGRWYPYSQFFERHPGCDCVQMGAKEAEAAGLIQDPREIYESLTTGQRTKAGWSEADQFAIDEGADIVQVTNVRRKENGRGGVYTAGGKQYTREGTTRAGLYGGYDIDPETGKITRRPRGSGKKPPRLTPQQIFEDADSREEAILKLRQYGYLFGQSSLQVPSTLDTDPALKMKVADLKQIAKDAGVPLLGSTKRADIVWILRNHELVHNVKLAGLPEWKAPKAEIKPDYVPPPLGKPAESKVLTGAALNNWSDYLKYDQENGRYQFVDSAGNTPAEGVRVQDLRTSNQGGLNGLEYYVKYGTAWRFDGIAYLIEHGPDEHGAPWVSRTLDTMRRAHAEIPAAGRANVSYTAVNRENPADPYWRKQYNNPDHVSAMTAGGGHITVWGFKHYSMLDVDSLRHETGHNLDDLAGRKIGGSDSPAWTAAAESDVRSAASIIDLEDRHRGLSHGLAKVEPGRGYPNGVTTYGRSSSAEDFAESVMLYQIGQIAKGRIKPGADIGPLYFRDIYPARAKILDTIFPDLAKAQIAELEELRTAKEPPPKLKKAATPPAKTAKSQEGDLSKLTVPQLKALAKERGISGYSKLTKPRLLEQLGVTPKSAIESLQQLSLADEFATKKVGDIRELAFQLKIDVRVARVRSQFTDVKTGAADFSSGTKRFKNRAELTRDITAAAATDPAVEKKVRDFLAQTGQAAVRKTAVRGQGAAGQGADDVPGVPARLGAGGQQQIRWAEGANPGWDAVRERRAATSLRTYGRHSYEINMSLRGLLEDGKRAKKQLAELIAGLDDITKASRLPADIETWRGIRDAHEMFGDRMQGDLTGMEWLEEGFTSTSARQRISQSFATQGGDGLLMRVRVPKGTGAAQVKGMKSEAEVLLQRGLRFRVVKDYGVDPAWSYRLVDIEVVP